ncbi:MAG: type IV secretion system DNA-binding domain-containing protein [Acidobacteriota bacterium]
MHFLSSLRISAYPISFEIIGLADIILIQFACREKDVSLLRSNLRAYFSDSKFRETSDFLSCNWPQQADRKDYPVVVDFGLSHEFVIPLQSQGGFSIDALIGVVASLSDVKIGEAAVLQVLFHGTQYDWANSAIHAATDMAGNSVLSNVPKMADCLRQKLSQPLFSAVFRVGTKSADQKRSWELAKRIGSALVSTFAVTGTAHANELIPLSNDGYNEIRHEEDLLLRHTHRSGMILNAEELVPLVRLPSPSVRSDKFEAERATKAAPPLTLGSENEKTGSVTLGNNPHEGETRRVSLSDKLRSRHVHVIGTTGSGKSTLLLHLIKQDMERGSGLCVIDPHGDLVDDIVGHIPEYRVKDVILFDPSDAEFPVGFNILHAHSELEKNLLSSDLVAVFRRMATSWGDVMDSVLANAILAFIESSEVGTLFDLRRFLVEKDFREVYLRTVSDESVLYFWKHEFPNLASKPQSSILIRLDAFLRNKLIRNIVCQKQTKLDFRQIMDQRKVLLIKLSQGLIGEENAHLLGTLLVSKLYQTALSRQDSKERPYCWTYLDEFQHFITPSMENILSGVRKYNIGLHLSHQGYRQLQSRSQDVASSVLSNCYTRICFRLGDTDSEKFATGFSFFDAKALQNLGIGEAIARVERAEYDFNLKTVYLPKVDEEIAESKRQAVIQNTRINFSSPKGQVEAELFAILRKEETIKYERVGKVGKTEKSVSNEQSKNKSAESGPREKGGPTAASRTPDFNSHCYLQNFLKRTGESHGFVATLEKQVFGGTGRIDVVLENEHSKIACEIAVTNTVNYELQNLQKCLASGFDKVVVISPDQKHLSAIKKGGESLLSVEQFSKVYFLEPEHFHLFLEKLNAESAMPKDEKVKGYNVNVSFRDDLQDAETRQQIITDILENAKERKR